MGSRTLAVSFEADSYKTARAIVNKLENGPYRCRVPPLDIEVSGGRKGLREPHRYLL